LLWLGTDKLKSKNNYTKKYFVGNNYFFIFVKIPIMKRIILILFCVLGLNAYSQDFRYKGPMNEKIFSEMTPFEKILYVDCLKEVKLESTPIVWVSGQTMKKVNNANYYIEVSTDNITEKRYKKINYGKNKLNNTECMITITRNGNRSRVKLTVYY
jgi:hypothetical protein